MAIYNPDAPSRQPLSRREKLLRAAGAAALLGVTAYLLANWDSLPVRLPSHYGLGGEIDSWSGRSSLGLLLGIGWGIWLLLLVTRHFPRGVELHRPSGHRSHPSGALCPAGRDAHRSAAGHCPGLCLSHRLATHLPAAAGVVVACVSGQLVRKPGVVSLPGSAAGPDPTEIPMNPCAGAQFCDILIY